MTQGQQDRSKERQNQQGKVLNTKPISIQFVDTPQDIRDAMHDLTALVDGTVRLNGTVRLELTSPTNAGEFLDCAVYTENDDDRHTVIDFLANRRIEITDESGNKRPNQSRWPNAQRSPRNG